MTTKKEYSLDGKKYFFDKFALYEWKGEESARVK